MNNRCCLTLLAILLSILSAQGQVNIENPFMGNDSVYIYKISNELYEKILQKGVQYEELTKEQEFLGEYVMTCPGNEAFPKLPQGNYWLITMSRNKQLLHLRLYQSMELGLNQITLRADKNLEVLFYDDYGKPLPNLTVTYNKKTSRLNPESQTYHLSIALEKRVETIVNRDGTNYPFSTFRWKPYTNPKDVPALHKFKKEAHRHYSKSYSGSNAYKPGDTIHIRETIYDYHRLFVNDNEGQLLETIYPDKNGLFSYEYIIPKDEKTSYYSNRLYLAKEKKRADYAKCIYYQIVPAIYTMDVSIDTFRHFTSHPPVLNIHITERDNKIAATDSIYIEAKKKDVHQPASDSVFVPDILFKETLPIKLNEDIRYSIPTHKFPPADFSYKLTTSLISKETSNTLQHKSFMVHIGSKEIIKIYTQNDQLLIERRNDTSSITSEGFLLSYIDNRLIDKRAITLPYSGKVNPAVSKYTVISKDIKKDFIPAREEHICLIDYSVSFSKDSAHISLSSAYDIPFWYTIWKNYKLQKIGYGDNPMTIGLKAKEKKDTFQLRLEYLWGGKIMHWQTPLASQIDSSFLSKEMQASEVGYRLSMHTDGIFGDVSYIIPIPASFVSERNISIKKLPGREEAEEQKRIHKLSELSGAWPRYSENSALFLTFRNTEKYQPEFTILVDKSANDTLPIFDRAAVFNSSISKIALKGNRDYSLYVLSGKEMSYKKDLHIPRNGQMYLTVDMNDILPLDEQIKTAIEDFSTETITRFIVTDASGEPVIGAMISIPASMMYVMTDIDGTANLKLPTGYSGYIEVSLIGMETEKIRYNGKSIIRVQMEERYELLD
ncbi:hypothetical protein [Dysgonomonas sp. 25]|uniref:hypothetical protein n=1 Tax=Dysgonomonas sp. 25 TaxID=2302933 RepID=UPI0013D0D7F2|nr:hypothetical protein [Dysgonomonas sp. 25]